jgi:hypothetical protein
MFLLLVFAAVVIISSRLLALVFTNIQLMLLLTFTVFVLLNHQQRLKVELYVRTI